MIILTLLLVNGTCEAGQSIEDLLPNDTDLSGWLREGESYIARDGQALMQYMNGAAPFYIERGNIEALFQDYRRGNDLLTLEIFLQKDLDSAKRLYGDVTLTGSKLLPYLGTEARWSEEFINTTVIEFWRDVFFVRLTSGRGSPDSTEAIMALARKVSENIRTIIQTK